MKRVRLRIVILTAAVGCVGVIEDGAVFRDVGRISSARPRITKGLANQRTEGDQHATCNLVGAV